MLFFFFFSSMALNSPSSYFTHDSHFTYTYSLVCSLAMLSFTVGFVHLGVKIYVLLHSPIWTWCSHFKEVICFLYKYTSSFCYLNTKTPFLVLGFCLTGSILLNWSFNVLSLNTLHWVYKNFILLDVLFYLSLFISMYFLFLKVNVRVNNQYDSLPLAGIRNLSTLWPLV